MKKQIVIINYGMGNIRSVFNAFSYLGYIPNVSSSIKDIVRADALILPGVGSFRVAMKHLTQNGMDEAIKDAVQVHQKQILGICLGFQLLSESSTEDGQTAGLNIMGGHITKFDATKYSGLKVPHVGFNTVKAHHQSVLYRGLGDENEFYFVHSFCMKNHSINQSNLAYCNYGETFVASYECNNVFATQFHPEKSQANGLKLLLNFIEF